MLRQSPLYLSNSTHSNSFVHVPHITSVLRHVAAHVVPKKGLDPYAIGRLKESLRYLGYQTVVLKSDDEPAIKALIPFPFRNANFLNTTHAKAPRTAQIPSANAPTEHITDAPTYRAASPAWPRSINVTVSREKA